MKIVFFEDDEVGHIVLTDKQMKKAGLNNGDMTDLAFYSESGHKEMLKGNSIYTGKKRKVKEEIK